MYYRLKSCYSMRGWKGMSWVLVKRPENHIETLKQDKFQVLMLCDGETELPGNLLDEELRDMLKQCEAEGIIEPCEKPCSLEPDQYYRFHANRFVMKVFWSITGRCNFRCRHCYMDAPEAKLGELSTEEALNLIDQMAECGVLRVDITGGEPLVRKDLWELVDRICSYKMVIGSFHTNGWLLNEKTLDAFEQRGLKPEISISFDGVGWHDWMRGITGAEEDALRALRLCHDRGFSTNVGMCIHRGNINSLPETVKALTKAGVSYLKTANIDETDLWRCHSDGNAMTRQEYTEAMIPYIRWYYDTGKPIEYLDIGGVAYLQRDKPGELRVSHYDGTEKCLDSYLCGAVRWSCYITPEGRLLPCMPMTACKEQERFPKVQEIGLKHGLDDSFYMQFVNGRVKDLLEVNQECASCEFRYKCGGGCRAAALLADHELMGCDRGKCMFWKNGYDEKIQKAMDEAVEKCIEN